MTGQEENKLAKLCEWSQDLYEDRVKQKIQSSVYDTDKEHAITRKLLKIFLDHLTNETPILEEDIKEFLQYNTDIENIKLKSKQSLMD